jgi:hypothetical protein
MGCMRVTNVMHKVLKSLALCLMSGGGIFVGEDLVKLDYIGWALEVGKSRSCTRTCRQTGSTREALIPDSEGKAQTALGTNIPKKRVFTDKIGWKLGGLVRN